MWINLDWGLLRLRNLEIICSGDDDLEVPLALVRAIAKSCLDLRYTQLRVKTLSDDESYVESEILCQYALLDGAWSVFRPS